MVTWENYEEYMMLYADDELDETGVQALLTFIGQHPELQAELKAYTATKLIPDAEEVYEGKEALLQPVPAKRVIAWKPWTMAAAAGVVLMIGFSALKWYHRPSARKEDDRASFAVRNIPPLKYQADLSAAEHRDTQRKTPVYHRTKALQRSSVMPAPVNRTAVAMQQPKHNHEELPGINPATSHTNDATIIPPPAPDAIAFTAALPQPAAGKKQSNLAWLPISEGGKEGINAVGEAINDRIEQVKKIKANLKETSLVLNFGRKEIIINL